MTDQSRTVAAFNSSTQSIKGVVLDPASGEILWVGGINYGAEFGDKYGTNTGFISRDDGVVVAPPLMWCDALDLLLWRMHEQLGHVEMARISRIAGAGQQHGTAYLSSDARKILNRLSPGTPLAQQLATGFFTRAESPIWRDKSTGAECAFLAERIGALQVAELTGSAPTERFSLPQIMRFARTEPRAYAQTQHVTLVSSLIASLFLGSIAPMEPGDGSGMNLMNIQTSLWTPTIAEAVQEYAAGLLEKLPRIVPSIQTVGRVSRYMVERYGFHPDAELLPFSGDNPDSLLGMGVVGLDDEMLVLSLGTSDTLFGPTKLTHDERFYANVMGNVMGGRFGLLCTSNASLTRELVRDKLFGGNWDAFNAALAATPPGNRGKFMLGFYAPEITPNTGANPLVHFLGGLSESDHEGCARALVEAQFMNLALQMRRVFGSPKVIRVTGGAAINRAILQIAADVLDATLVLMEGPSGTTATDSVSMGGAIRAASTLGYGLPALVGKFCVPQGDAIRPQNAAAYSTLIGQYEAALNDALSA